MKNGLFYENDELIYYKDDAPHHAGAIEVEGAIYYIGVGGRAVKGKHVVHKSMANGILKRGTYKFGDDYKLVEGSYAPPTKRKRRRKLKKYYPLILCSVGIAVILLTLYLVSAFINGDDSEKSSTDVVDTIVFKSEDIIIFKIDDEVLLCSPEAKKLYDAKLNGKKTIEKDVLCENPYRPFEFKYKIKAKKNGVFILSEKEDFSEIKSFVLPYNAEVLYIDNLKTDTTYYYRISCDDTEYNGSFKTAQSTRFVSMPGVKNTRDIGGYKTLDGKTVKQGYIIRGTEIDGLKVSEYYLEQDSIDYVREEFGFVYELDLRSDTVFNGIYSSRLGNDVKHKFYDSPTYGSIFNASEKDTVKEIFEALANPENYPMYLHCTYGADRTGSIVFLLQGLLNIPEEEMFKEYRRTAYLKPVYTTKSEIEIMSVLIGKYDGETINEKIEDFMINYVGLSQEDIESIRNILLE